MQSKNIDLKLYYGTDNSKMIFTPKYETIISFNGNMEIKLFIYNYDEEFAQLQKPLIKSIPSKQIINSYDVITNNDEIMVYLLVEEAIEKYTFSTNDDEKQVSLSGDNDRNSFNMVEKCYLSKSGSIEIMASKDGSVICVTFTNGNIHVYDTKKLFQSSNQISELLFEVKDSFPMFIQDISVDASLLITMCSSANEKMASLWSIGEKKKMVDLIHPNNADNIVDCVFGRSEAESGGNNVYGLYNSAGCKCYWIVNWDCSACAVKSSLCVQSKSGDKICVSKEGRYVTVSSFDTYSMDVFTSYNLQKLYTYSKMDTACANWSNYFLPLSFSVGKLHHEFDLLCLDRSKESTAICWLYEPLRTNYSIVWPVSAAAVLIVAVFYVAFCFDL